MVTVLLTAFEPYGPWKDNASWLALVELTRNLPENPQVTTRRYPVDFAEMKRRLTSDLRANYDFAVHLGQCPGASWIRLEAVGLNIGAPADALEASPLEVGGPPAYHSRLPLGSLASSLSSAGIPSRVSYAAGTFLCNATLYWSQRLADQQQLKTQSLFVHLPLDTSQVLAERKETPYLPAATSAQALHKILAYLCSYAT